MKKKILIVDDEESIRFTFQSFLSKEGYEVLTADNYASATGVLSKNDPDVLFVDIILEKKSGLDLLREVKRRGSHCPVVMITGKPDIDNAAEALRMGAFDYLPKPIKKEVLLHIAHQAVTHKNILDEKAAVEAEKEKYRLNLGAVFRSLKDGIVAVDHGFKIQDMNAPTLHLCGLDPKQIAGKPLDDLLLPCAQTCRKVLKQTLNTKETISDYRVECQHPDHPNQVVSLTCSPLLDLNDQSVGALLVIRDITNLVDLERRLKEQHQFHSIVGKSKKMQELYRLVEDLADQDTTVLITGESGTGKELVANALHYTGLRAFKPQVKVNCSALVENLLESELFGHVRGAYTGAVTTQIGRFEKAHQGTIFLDEIGGLSPGIQMKLLRVLQEKEFERVGDTIPIKVDVRIIASTNSDLKEKVRKGEFRLDLYYRLKVVELNLPPLRDRREDIPLLWEYFIHLFNKRFKKQILGLSDEVQRVFLDYSWPGNVRELEHALEHAFVLCHGETIILDHLPQEIREVWTDQNLPESKENRQESEDILIALKQTDWNKAKAARLLGISRPTLYRKIDEYKLQQQID